MLYERDEPLPEAISRLLAIAGDNPNAFDCFSVRNGRERNKSRKGQAIRRLFGTAAMERDASDPNPSLGSGWWPPSD